MRASTTATGPDHHGIVAAVARECSRSRAGLPTPEPRPR